MQSAKRRVQNANTRLEASGFLLLFTIHRSQFTARKRGFTLIEILLAVAIFSVISAALYSTFFLSQKAVETVDDSLQRLQESRAIIDTITREIESSLYPTDPSRAASGYYIFKVDDRDFYGKQASGITLTCFSPVVNGLAKIRYEVTEREGKLLLRKSIASAFSKTPEPAPPELMEDLDSFTVEVRYGDKWVKAWDSAMTKSTPDEVRVSLTMKPGKEQAPEEKASPTTLTISDTAKPRLNRTL